MFTRACIGVGVVDRGVGVGGGVGVEYERGSY